MSLRPKTPGPYGQGLRKPSGAMPFASRKSSSNEIMPATICELEVSWLFEDRGRRAEKGGSMERCTGAAQLVPFVSISLRS